MKKHSPQQTAMWAAENGIRGYEYLDPRNRDKKRKGHYRSNRRVDSKSQMKYK